MNRGKLAADGIVVFGFACIAYGVYEALGLGAGMIVAGLVLIFLGVSVFRSIQT